MNRVIKFQFIIDNKHISKPYTIEEILNGYDELIIEDMETCNCVLTESCPSCEGDCCKFENSTITSKRQFTGLHDKNGKEIYEGDLVLCENAHKDFALQNLLVTFEDGAFCLRELKSTNFGKAITFRDNITNCVKNTFGDPIYCIVGNRFENPELCE